MKTYFLKLQTLNYFCYMIKRMVFIIKTLIKVKNSKLRNEVIKQIILGKKLNPTKNLLGILKNIDIKNIYNYEKY